MPFAGSGVDRVLGDGQDDDRDAEAGLAQLLDELQALDRPWSRASTMTTSGLSCWTWAMTLRAVGHDVEELDCALRVQQAPDVLRDLRDVLDEEQAHLVARCHRDECTKAERTRPTGPEVRRAADRPARLSAGGRQGARRP